MKKKKNISRRLTKDEKIDFLLKIAMVTMITAAIVFFSYPFFIDSMNNFLDQRQIEKFHQKTANISESDREQKLRELQEDSLHSPDVALPEMENVEDPFEVAVEGIGEKDRQYYQSHTIGAIYIPAIQVSLPLFDTTNQLLLDKGATLFQGSSFPGGGISTHSVITGHTGLPNKTLFTDLEKLQVGDLFYVEVFGELFAYELFEKQIVEPTDLQALDVRPGEELVTLVTCTPYMINSHRLLWTGKPTVMKEQMQTQIQVTQNYHKKRIVGFGLGIFGFSVLVGFWLWRKVVLFRSHSRDYELSFIAVADGEPMAGATFVLRDYRGRPLKNLPEETQQVISDHRGNVVFQQLPGNIYQVAVLGESKKYPTVRAKVWRVSDSFFTLRLVGKGGTLEKRGKRQNRHYTICYRSRGERGDYGYR